MSDAELVRQILSQLGGWFGSAVKRWELVRTSRIACALPVRESRWTPSPDRPIQVRPGTLVAMIIGVANSAAAHLFRPQPSTSIGLSVQTGVTKN